MLAFNLGVFFRNLRGEEVSLRARNERCEVRFSGGVENLVEHTDLAHRLSVTLISGALLCRIAFEEAEEEQETENTEVEIELVQLREEREVLLLQTSFRFDEITLKPTAGEVEETEDDPIPA